MQKIAVRHSGDEVANGPWEKGVAAFITARDFFRMIQKVLEYPIEFRNRIPPLVFQSVGRIDVIEQKSLELQTGLARFTA